LAARRPHLGRRHATEGAAENGLGRVALFFIGVTLALLAGLAALFALIPGVSFWGGLGLAVGALVVLFLLYSLVSGGKKKKA
jgi:O-antigen/teichoic acid export membrane protein